MKNAMYMLVVLAAIPCQARTITVDDDNPADFNNIQAAIDDAIAGDVVEIQPGTYTGDGNRNIDFLGKPITVTGTDPNDPNVVAQTIIDCQGTEAESHRGFDFHSGEGAGSVLRGITITNGHAHGPGGAIKCDDASSPTIIDCIVAGNISGVCEGSERGWDCTTGNGGGIYCRNESNPLIENCTIIDNTVIGEYVGDGTGGGISCQRSSPSVMNCTVIGNTAGSGGGLYSGPYSAPIIADCVISDNNATSDGGGLACRYNNRDVGETISRCIITGNSATSGGGILAGDYTKVNDCLIAGNTATDSGGGIGTGRSYSGLKNCTIANNTATSGGGARPQCGLYVGL